MALASRQPSYLIAGLGGFLQVVAGWLDVFSHSLYGRVNPGWNIASLLFYAAVACTLFGVWLGIRVHPEPPPLSPIRFVNLAGLKLAGLGCLIEIVACVWSETVHRIAGGELGLVPPYALLAIGILTVNLGVVIGLTIEYGMIRREFLVVSASRRAMVAFFVLLAFSSIWLAASASLIYLAGMFMTPILSLVTAFMLALFATFVLVPLKKVMPKIGSGIGISVIFSTVAFVLLVFYGKSSSYVPWGILPIALFELILIPLNSRVGFKRAAMFSAGLVGVFFGIIYFPFTLYLFPWSVSLGPAILCPVAGSIVGALLGNITYSRLSSLVLGDVTASL